jgi:hypothetical protein
MTATQPEPLTAYLTTVDGYGEKQLDVIPGDEGSGLAPILTVALGDDAVLSDAEEILRKHGLRTIKTHIDGVLDQPGHWTNTDFGAVASVERI